MGCGVCLFVTVCRQDVARHTHTHTHTTTTIHVHERVICTHRERHTHTHTHTHTCARTHTHTPYRSIGWYSDIPRLLSGWCLSSAAARCSEIRAINTACRYDTMPMACYPCLSSSKHHVEYMVKVRLDLMSLFAMACSVTRTCLTLSMRWRAVSRGRA